MNVNIKMIDVRKVLVILLAALVIVSFGAISWSASLDAAEDAPAEYVEAAAEDLAPTVVIEELNLSGLG